MSTTAREIKFPDEYENQDDVAAKSDEQLRQQALSLEARDLKKLYFKYKNAFRVYCGMEEMGPTSGFDSRELEVDGKKLPLWEGNVARIRKIGMSPSSYMNLVVYAAQTGRVMFPYPNALTGVAMLRSMVEFKKQRATQFDMSLKLQKNEIASLLKIYDKEPDATKRLLLALTAPLNSLTPLFCFLMVHELKGEIGTNARRTYYREAAAQYMSDPDMYDMTWGSILPPRFCKKARGSE